jgi:pyruvate,water dikinase
MERYVLGLAEIDRTQIAAAGGKGANLGELARVEGIDVPAGFCLTTAAFRRVVAADPAVAELLDRLTRVDAGEREEVERASAALRGAVESATISDELTEAVTAALHELGAGAAYAVRSSATAEDLPGASSAGQHESFLNVVGVDEILRHVRRCWASLHTERAVVYRSRNGVDHRSVQMAVVVQRMVAADAAGVVFTADPVTSNRRVCAIEATVGLAEALVSGRATPDVYRVRGGVIVEAALAADRPVLTEGQIIQLERVARTIEAHFGRPQDVEWCLAGGGWQIVQSRPITTLFPIPVRDDDANHVYVSVGHQQMMTEAMRPLGISFWQLTAAIPMYTAGSRLFVDVGPMLASPARRAAVIEALGKSDPLIGGALQAIADRGGVIPIQPDEPPPPAATPDPIANDPAIVAGLIARNQASVATLRREIEGRTGTALLDVILDDVQEMKRLLFVPENLQAIMAGMEATWWLNDHVADWLGEHNVADVLTRSAPGNVTSEMGLALLDVADVIRTRPEVVALLERVEGDRFLDDLDGVPGGGDAAAAIRGYLDRYGMRCVGEIDITRPRWSERPATLVPLILANVRQFEPGEHERRLEQGRRAASAKEVDLLERLRRLPGGEEKAADTARMIERLRMFIGYREYPKYGMISRYFVYRQALLSEAGRLVAAGVLDAVDDMYYLTFPELQAVVRSGVADRGLIGVRRDAFRADRALTPPRVFTSDGEVVTGSYGRSGGPAGALIGLPVSAGTVEGRARVVTDIAGTAFEPGDILVTTCTDPSWTPVFVSVAGLVTEVGGAMTHGAVIAREYGLPAVVGVEQATALIADGQRIRVHGDGGYVELLDS